MPLNFPLSTAADYINGRVLRHMAQLRPGWTASPELQQDILQEWLALVDELNAESDMAVSIPQYTYPITGPGYLGNNRDYKLGPGAPDFNGPRPSTILKAALLITTTTPNTRIPIRVMPWDEYADIPVLTIPATGIATELYIEETFPVAILHFSPPINANSLQIWTSGVMVAPAVLATVVAGTFPPGYENYFVYTLAHRCQYLATKEMGPRNPLIGAWALRAKQRLQNINRTNPECRSDFQTGHSRAGTTSGNLTLIGEL
jgi:hypothetical protein